MEAIKLDKNYRIKKDDLRKDFSPYSDNLNETVEKILNLRDRGKINDNLAKALLKIFLEKSLKEEIDLSFSSFSEKKRNDKSRRMLLLRWANETSYV